MKKQTETKAFLSRRKFLGTAVAATVAASTAPIMFGCKSDDDNTEVIPPYVTGEGVPNSKFGGVQIGAITFSFNRMPGKTAEDILRYCVESGVSSVELMGEVAEQYAGIPPAPGRPPRDMTMSPQQQAEYEASVAKSSEEQRLWRLSAPMEKFEELRKMFNDAGVNIHMAKFAPAQWSDEEIDYAFNAAKALGTKAVSEELGDEACKRLGPFAEKHGMLAVFHNHTQFEDPEFTIDPFLAYSPSIMLNLDTGHYYGTTGLSPRGFITQYHDRIYSIHLKDSTCPLTTHQVWGQGMTPIADELLCIKENQWPIYCDIEMVYPVQEWSDAVKEVRTCVNYARNILI